MMTMSLQPLACSGNLSEGCRKRSEIVTSTTHFQNLSGRAGELRIVESWGSSGHCAETGLPGCTAGASAQLRGGERRARRGTLQGWLRSTHPIPTCAPTRPAVGGSGPQLGGVGPSRALLEERGSSLQKPLGGSPFRKIIENRGGRWAWAGGKKAPSSADRGWARRESPPWISGKGSPLRSRAGAGWGRAFVWPGGAPASFSAEPPAPLGGARYWGWEPRRGSVHIKGCLDRCGLRDWKKRFRDCIQLNCPSHIPLPRQSRSLRSPQLRAEGGAGRSRADGALSAVFPVSASCNRVPGDTCFQLPQDPRPHPACPSRGHWAPEPWALKAEGQLRMKALNPESFPVILCLYCLSLWAYEIAGIWHCLTHKTEISRGST